MNSLPYKVNINHTKNATGFTKSYAAFTKSFIIRQPASPNFETNL